MSASSGITNCQLQKLTMLEADMSSSVRVPSSRLGTALSIATMEPLHETAWGSVVVHCAFPELCFFIVSCLRIFTTK